ncbi:MAG: type III-B CRISPR module RAMP protein Cmr1 [Methylobacter sp.]|nr:type III-B CRISPR module RAMP protein Cmr1 [Methylobacter sp.]
MFIGGGDSSDLPELRPPSIKGALRFWWRALQWGECLKNNPDPQTALRILHQQEGELFGLAAKSETNNGQGAFFLKLNKNSSNGIVSDWPKNNDDGAGFLGYGLDVTKNNNSPHKKAIRKGEFSLCLVLKKTITKRQIEQLKQVLKLWGLLGGLGSRSRRGFGSVALKKLDGECFDFADKSAYFNAIRAFFEPVELAPAMPIFTAVNQAMVIAVMKHDRGCMDYKHLMNSLGQEYKNARSDAGKAVDRLPFGLPLAKTDEKNRRSSPLLMHIHHTVKGYVAIVSFIPANFHFHDKYSKGNDIAFYTSLQKYMATMEAIYP